MLKKKADIKILIVFVKHNPFRARNCLFYKTLLVLKCVKHFLTSGERGLTEKNVKCLPTSGFYFLPDTSQLWFILFLVLFISRPFPLLRSTRRVL